MLPVQVAVLGNPFRLYPNAKLDPFFRDTLRQLLQGTAKLLFIWEPIAQPRTVLIPVPKPAVIHCKQFNPQFLCLLCNVNQLFPGKIKIRCLPVIHQDWAASFFPFPPADILPDYPMEIPAYIPHAVPAVGHNHFREPKGIAALQGP